jgi:hypothetical protein
VTVSKGVRRSRNELEQNETTKIDKGGEKSALNNTFVNMPAGILLAGRIRTSEPYPASPPTLKS